MPEMHPWHDVYIDEDQLSETFPVVIEVPMGSKNKYELDKRTGMLRLDRVLYSAVHYPANYGFLPRTFCDDGDPLFYPGADDPPGDGLDQDCNGIDAPDCSEILEGSVPDATPIDDYDAGQWTL